MTTSELERMYRAQRENLIRLAISRLGVQRADAEDLLHTVIYRFLKYGAGEPRSLFAVTFTAMCRWHRRRPELSKCRHEPLEARRTPLLVIEDKGTNIDWILRSRHGRHVMPHGGAP